MSDQNKILSIRKIFWDNPYQSDLETRVVSVENNYVLFEETIAFSFSGGQESDHACVNGFLIVDSKMDGNLIYYVLPDIIIIGINNYQTKM